MPMASIAVPHPDIELGAPRQALPYLVEAPDVESGPHTRLVL